MSFLVPNVVSGLASKGSRKTAQNYNVYSPNVDKFSPSYQGLAESNPYANAIYRQSKWQKILEGLGFRTNKDAYLESMNLQAREYENQLLQKQYNESYDSPLAQAEREAAAGLNPDLTGNIDSGSSSPMVDDGNPPISPEADDYNFLSTFASSCLDGLQAAFGMAKDFVSLKPMIKLIII